MLPGDASAASVRTTLQEQLIKEILLAVTLINFLQIILIILITALWDMCYYYSHLEMKNNLFNVS